MVDGVGAAFGSSTRRHAGRSSGHNDIAVDAAVKIAMLGIRPMPSLSTPVSTRLSPESRFETGVAMR